MNGDWLEVREYGGPGYRPLIEHGEWRVAVLNFSAELQPGRIRSMERHRRTDEVFVLLAGRAVLLLGGDGERVETVRPEPMRPGRVYNVRRDAWHSLLLSPDASLLIVENRDTAQANSETQELTPDLRRQADAIGLDGSR